LAAIKLTGRKKGLIPPSDANRSRKPVVSQRIARNLSKDLGVRLDFADPLSDAFTAIQTFLRGRMQTLENDKMLIFVYLEKGPEKKTSNRCFISQVTMQRFLSRLAGWHLPFLCVGLQRRKASFHLIRRTRRHPRKHYARLNRRKMMIQCDGCCIGVISACDVSRR
jgi:hypothetical protein